jgi:hypothetical protein
MVSFELIGEDHLLALESFYNHSAGANDPQLLLSNFIYITAWTIKFVVLEKSEILTFRGRCYKVKTKLEDGGSLFWKTSSDEQLEPCDDVKGIILGHSNVTFSDGIYERLWILVVKRVNGIMERIALYTLTSYNSDRFDKDGIWMKKHRTKQTQGIIKSREEVRLGQFSRTVEVSSYKIWSSFCDSCLLMLAIEISKRHWDTELRDETGLKHQRIYTA